MLSYPRTHTCICHLYGVGNGKGRRRGASSVPGGCHIRRPAGDPGVSSRQQGVTVCLGGSVWLCVSLHVSVSLGGVSMCLSVPESMYVSGICLGGDALTRTCSFTGESLLFPFQLCLFSFLPSPDLRMSSAHSSFSSLITFDWGKHAPTNKFGFTSSSTILH